MNDLILFLKAQRKGAADKMGDLFGEPKPAAALVDKQIQHQGYVDKKGHFHDPQLQRHKVKAKQPKQAKPAAQMDLFGQPKPAESGEITRTPEQRKQAIIEAINARGWFKQGVFKKEAEELVREGKIATGERISAVGDREVVWVKPKTEKPDEPKPAAINIPEQVQRRLRSIAQSAHRYAEGLEEARKTDRKFGGHRYTGEWLTSGEGRERKTAMDAAAAKARSMLESISDPAKRKAAAEYLQQHLPDESSMALSDGEQAWLDEAEPAKTDGNPQRKELDYGQQRDAQGAVPGDQAGGAEAKPGATPKGVSPDVGRPDAASAEGAQAQGSDVAVSKPADHAADRLGYGVVAGEGEKDPVTADGSFSVGDALSHPNDVIKLPPGSVLALKWGEGERKALVGRGNIWLERKSGGGFLKNPMAPGQRSRFINQLDAKTFSHYSREPYRVVSLGHDDWLTDAQRKTAETLVANREGRGLYRFKQARNAILVGKPDEPASFRWVDEKGEWGGGWTPKQKRWLETGEFEPIDLGGEPKQEAQQAEQEPWHASEDIDKAARSVEEYIRAKNNGKINKTLLRKYAGGGKDALQMHRDMPFTGVQLAVDKLLEQAESKATQALSPLQRAEKAKKLERKADELTDRARSALSGMEPGQPVVSTADRNRRDRSADTMRQAIALRREAEALRNPATNNAEAEPKAGDTKTENGITYELRDGRWHRVTAEESAEQEPETQDKPAEKAQYTLEEVMDLADAQLGEDETFEVFNYLDQDGLTNGPWPARDVHRAIRQVRREGMKATAKQAKQALLTANGGEALGVEAKHKDGAKYGAVLPDASEAGKFRNSRWDERGFYTHQTFDTAEAALDDLVAGGFTEPAAGALDRMSQTDEWARGMELTAEIQRENERRAAGRQEQPAEPDPQPTVIDKLEFGVPEGATKGQRKAWNQAALDLLKSHPEGQPWTPEEKQVLARYSGQGGVGGSLNEFYTREDVAAAGWSLAKSLGFEGNALEMSCGTGVFAKTAPEAATVTGVELDEVSSQIAKAVFDIEVHNTSAEQFARSDGREFDLVIGNPPYGPRGSLIGEDKKNLATAEQYFLDTAIDKANDGGLVVQVVPTGILDSSSAEGFRDRLSRKAVFLGAFRLPNTAFSHSHTGVTTDIVVFRARPKGVAGVLAGLTRDEMAAVTDPQAEFVQGGYFRREGGHPDIYGTLEAGWRTKAGMGNDITVSGSMDGVADAIAQRQLDRKDDEVLGLDPAGIIAKIAERDAAQGLAPDAIERHTDSLIRRADDRPYTDAKIGDIKTINGVSYRLEGEPPRWHRIDDDAPPEALTAAQGLAPLLRVIHEQHQDGSLSDDARKDAREAVQAYVDKHGVPSQNADLMTELKLNGDRDLYRVVGAINEDGSLSDLLTGKQAAGEISMEGLAQRLSLQQGGFTAAELAEQLKGGNPEVVTDALLASDEYMLDGQHWLSTQQYLTGNLWERLDRARDLMGHEGLGDAYRAKYAKQEQALLETINPKLLDDVEIEMRSAWVGPELLTEWLEEGRQATNQRAIDKGYKAWDDEPVSISFENGIYTMTGHGFGGDRDLILKYLNRGSLRKEDDKPTIDRLNHEFKQWLLTSDHREDLEERYNRTFLGYVKPEQDDSPLTIPGLNPEFDINAYHYAGLRWAMQAEKGIIAADVGLGKAQPLDANILTPHGWVQMGDIQAGDRVITVNGAATRVEGVYPQGEKEIYRVTFSDGAVTECCEEHLWLTQTHLERNNARQQRSDLGIPKVRSLAEIRETLTYRGMKNHAVPMVGRVEFDPREVDIDPYVLGALLGDGKLSYSTPVITNPEDGIIEAMRARLPEGYQLRKAGQETRCPSYYLSRKDVDGFSGNGFSSALKRYDINCKSGKKHVPEDYLFNTPEVRLAVLQGLMDTDGYVSKEGVTVQYTSVSEQLARDVAFLANSLGGNATTKSKIPTYTHGGEKRSGQRAYTVHLRLPADVDPFLHSVKRERVIPKSKYVPVRYIVGIDPVGRKQAQCIKVEHPSHLYVTDDFIVTHNTGRGLMLGALARAHGRAKKPTYVVPKSVLANWVAETDAWFPDSNILVIGEEYERDENGALKRDAKGNLKAKSDSAETKARKLAQLAQNNYDFVFISQPAWNAIDLDPLAKGEMLETDFWVQRGKALDQAGDARTRKIREQYDQAVAKREFHDRSAGAYFNDLGIDFLVIDEMHMAKNLFSVKTRWGDSPRFLGGGGQSNRAHDTNLKAKWFLQHNQNRNIYGLTATPTKNSPLEVYSMLHHICPEEFEAIGIRNSEEFIDRFVEFEPDQYLTTTGEIDTGLVCAGFKNLDELRPIMERNIDRTTAAQVGLKLPEAKHQTHYVDMSPLQQQLYAELRELAKPSDGGDGEHIFRVIDQMSKTSLDPALLSDNHAGAETPKLDKAAENILSGIKDGGQVVFCDYLGGHDTLKAKLIAAGVDPKRIAIVNAKAAPSASKREGISDQFNKGKLDVVIGNTATMGEGMNLQKRTADIHHLDMPWEPASIQQRNGRGLRQGNKNESIRIHTYMAKGSFDGYRWQTLMSKGDWQDQIWNGGDRVDNPMRQTGFSREDIAIMMSSDPEAARTALQAETEVAQARRDAAERAKVSLSFQELQQRKRTYAGLKQPDSKTGRALKAAIDKQTDKLRSSAFFPHKAALDSGQTGLLEPTTGELWAPDVATTMDGDTWVVDAVDLDKQTVEFRKYGDNGTYRRTKPLDELASQKTVPYSREAEDAHKVNQQRLVSVKEAVKDVSTHLNFKDVDSVAQKAEAAVEKATAGVHKWHEKEATKAQVEVALLDVLSTMTQDHTKAQAAARSIYRSYLFAAHGVKGKIDSMKTLASLGDETIRALGDALHHEARARMQQHRWDNNGKLFAVEKPDGGMELRPTYDASRVTDRDRLVLPTAANRERAINEALYYEASKRLATDYSGPEPRGKPRPDRLDYAHHDYSVKSSDRNPVIDALGDAFPGLEEDVKARADAQAVRAVEAADSPQALLAAASQFYAPNARFIGNRAIVPKDAHALIHQKVDELGIAERDFRTVRSDYNLNDAQQKLRKLLKLESHEDIGSRR